MNFLPRVSILFSLMFLLGAANATPQEALNTTNLKKISNNLTPHSFIQGEFVQERKLTGFGRTLRSTGRYLFWRDHGLYWEIQQPFFRASTFGNNASISWSAPGQISSKTRPKIIQKQIGKVLVAVLGTDIETLKKYFVVDASVTDNEKLKWTAQLKPKDMATKKALEQLSLTGTKSLKSIVITSANGDTTTIEFTKVNASDGPTEDLCELFYPDNTECQ
ncbi:MAG: outer membrane lipoprotein carrier protein LolA [Agarilytica sp.]